MTDPTDTKSEPDPRRRLRALLSVPERERTDEQWDEIVSLEIQLAPGNRIEPSRRGDNPPPSPGMRQQPGRDTGSQQRSGRRKSRKQRG